tara:strand:+ start:1181 stop:1315 length:135 start_codon:yes stop_codon:yes gene_type:complete
MRTVTPDMERGQGNVAVAAQPARHPRQQDNVIGLSAILERRTGI